MFGSKKEIEELKNRVEELEKENEALKDTLDITKTEISDMSVNVSQNVSDLGLIEESILDSATNRESIERSMKVLKRGMSLLIEKDNSTREKNKDEETRWNSMLLLLSELMEQKDKKMQNIEKLKNPAAKMEKTIGDLEELVTSLTGISKSMSVASLNSAIEAGHLGEQGVRYVETAEKMRSMSEDYKAKAELCAKSLLDIKDAFYEEKDSMIKLEDAIVREDSELKKISAETESFLDARRKQNEMEESFSADELLHEVEGLENNVSGLEDRMSSISEKFKYHISNAEKNESDIERILNAIKKS